MSKAVVEDDGWTIRSSNQSPDAVDGRPALAAIRPEAVQLREEQPEDPVNSVPGTLAGISHLGDVIQFVVLTKGQKEILCRLPGRGHRSSRWAGTSGARGSPTWSTCSTRNRRRWSSRTRPRPEPTDRRHHGR